MSHDEIIMQKQAMARRGIEEDLGLELRSYPMGPDSLGAQFTELLGERFPRAKPRSNGKAVGDSLAMIRQTPIYRVKINNNASIDTDCYDLIDLYYPKLDKHYAKVEDLPKWVQEKLAVLMVIDPEQVGGREVEGVGRRIDKMIFWVYDYGNDAGKDC